MENSPLEKLAAGNCVEDAVSCCSCSNCGSSCCVDKLTQKKSGNDQSKHVQYVATVSMAEQPNYDDPIIQQVLKYVASIHSKLSKHSVAQKIGGDPQNWQYIVVKGKDSTKIICKMASNQSLHGTQKPTPAASGTMEEPRQIYHISQLVQSPNFDQKLAYIFAKCPVSSKKSNTSICLECQNLKNHSTLGDEKSEICSQCQKYDEMYSNQFSSYSKHENTADCCDKYFNNYQRDNSRKEKHYYDNLCSDCQSAVQQNLKTDWINQSYNPQTRGQELCTFCQYAANVPSLQMKSVTPEVCSECRPLLNRNEIYPQKCLDGFDKKVVLCPDCKNGLNMQDICGGGSSPTFHHKFSDMDLCSECRSIVNVKKEKPGIEAIASSKETCPDCQFVFDSKSTRMFSDQQYFEHKPESEGICNACNDLNSVKNYVCSENYKSITIPHKDTRITPNCCSDIHSKGNCPNCSPRTDLQDIAKEWESVVDSTGYYQNRTNENDNLTRLDILGTIIQAYKACSCKVCECFSSKNVIATDGSCQCKPCECPDCTKMAMERTGCVFSTFPCFIQNNSCFCKPCDCVKCTKMIAATQCDCKPCQCIKCSKLQETQNVMPQVEENFTNPECACSPCKCINCQMNATIPERISRHEISTDTATFRHLDCACEDCVTETCQSLSTGSCLCSRKNKVMMKPFGIISNDFDIRTATVKTNNIMSSKKSKKDLLTTYAALTNIQPMFLRPESMQSNHGRREMESENPQKPAKTSSHFTSSKYKYNDIKENLKSRKQLVTNDSCHNNWTKSSNLAMSGSRLSHPSQLLDKSIHQPAGHNKNRNNVNMALYTSTYNNALQNVGNDTHFFDVKSLSSQVTHTSSYTNDIPTKDETESCEFGCVKEIKTRTRTSNKAPSKFVEEYYIPIYETNKISQSVYSTSSDSKKKHHFENHTSSTCIIKSLNPREIRTVYNKSSTSTSVTQSRTFVTKLKESKSTQDRLKRFICINEKDKSTIKKYVTDAETHISSTSLTTPYIDKSIQCKITSNSSKLKDQDTYYASTSYNSETQGYFQDLNVYEKIKENVTGMYELNPTVPKQCVEQNELKRTWVKENESVMKRIGSELRHDHPNSVNENSIVPKCSEKYRKAQSMLECLQTFSNQLMNVLQIFESINEEFQSVSNKINGFNGRIVNDLHKIREMILKNDYVIPRQLTFQIPISTTDTKHEISIFKSENMLKCSQDDVKFKHVSFNNDTSKQVIVRKFTNEEYEELNKDIKPQSLTDVPVFEDDYAQFVVLHLPDKTIDVIDVDNHVTIGEIPFKKEEIQLKCESINSIQKLCDAFNGICSPIKSRDSYCKNFIKSTIQIQDDLDNGIDYVDATLLNSSGVEITNLTTFHDSTKRYEWPITRLLTVHREDSWHINSNIEEESQESNDIFLRKKTSLSSIHSEIDLFGDNEHIDQQTDCTEEIDDANAVMKKHSTRILQEICLTDCEDEANAAAAAAAAAARNEIFAQTSTRHIVLRDAEMCCSYKNFIDIGSNRTKEICDGKVTNKSEVTFFGTRSRDLLDFMPGPFSGSTTCEYLKVSDLGVRKISNHSVVVKWEKPMAFNQVCGYELLIDGKPVNKTLGPSACTDVVRCLPSLDKVLITVKTVAKVQDLDHHPSSTVVYCPRVKCINSVFM